MSNRVALILAGVIAVTLALDLTFEWGGSLYLARKALALMDSIAIWR